MSAENPSFDQLHQQLDAGHRRNMTMLVEGEDGRIITANFAGKRQAESEMYQVEVTNEDGTKEFKFVPPEDMTDEKQAELAEALGATRAVSEIVDSPEHAESHVSEAERHELGEAALEAVAVESEQQAEPEAAETEEATEVKTELPEEMKETISMFTRRAGETLEELQRKATSEQQLLDELTNGMNTLRYGDVSNKQNLLQQQMEIAGQLRSAFQQDTDSGLRTLIVRFQGELEEQVNAVKKAEDSAEELAQKVRIIDNAAEDIAMVGRNIDGLSEELVDEVSGLMRTYEEFLYSNGWGDETYVSMLTQKLATLEDSLHMRRGRVYGVVNELPVLENAIR